MENVSLGTSSASSNNENEPIPQPSKENKVKESVPPPLGGIQTCFLQAAAVPNHIPPTSEETSFSQTFQSDPAVTIHSAKPVILVHSPSQETSDDATSSTGGTSRPRIVPTGSATPVICRVNQSNDSHAIPSAVVTRQKSTADIKGSKPKPPPPPRKPNCSSRSHAFPPLPQELLVGIGATPLSQIPSYSNDTIRPQGPGVTDV
jgi:hypothetical protein